MNEEACARVVASEYLASQLVSDPEHPEGRTSYYQTRWWAPVHLEEWSPHFETTARRLVRPEELASSISWSDTTILSQLLDLAIKVESRYRQLT